MVVSSRRRPSADSRTITVFRMRACTASSAPSRDVQRSKSATSASTRSSISRVLAPLLPRRPRNSSSCSDCPRRRSARRRPADWRSCSTTPTADCTSRSCRLGNSWATRASSSGGRRLAARRSGSRSTRAASASRADSGNTRASGTPSISAVLRRCCSICWCTACGGISGSISASILFSTTKRSRLAWPRWSRQMLKSDRVTPVSAPSTKTTAWADGSRPSVSSGSAPMALRPGVSMTTSPRLSRGCG